MSNLGLATDVGNANFSGAMNPDDLISVEFYWHQPIDKWASEQTGKQVFLDRMPFVRYGRPGDRLTVIEVPVDDSHKRRWPRQWMAWQMKEGLLESGISEVPGWSIDQWDELNADQIHELKYLRYSTVEQIAGASDQQAQKMGMGGFALREKAKRALLGRTNSLAAQEIEARDKIIAEQGAKIGELGQKLDMLLQAIEGGALRKDEPAVDPDLEQLRAAYEQKFGKKPHHKTKAETLRKDLEG